jgi:hypothetical protein
MRVTNEEIHLRTKPAWVVQAAGGDSDDPTRPLIGFSAGDPGAAFGAKAAFVFATCKAVREMVTQLSFREPKC